MGRGGPILACDVRKNNRFFFEKAHNKKLILTCIPIKAAVKHHKMSTKHMMGVTDCTSAASTFQVFLPCYTEMCVLKYYLEKFQDKSTHEVFKC